MSVPFNQNLDNTEKLVEAPEFIEFWMGYTLLDTNYIDKWTN
ncbi:hypothetical protein [Spiroplasma endosymbiont of Phycita roborella]